MKRQIFLLSCLAFTLAQCLSADEDDVDCICACHDTELIEWVPLPPNQVFLGPEVYHTRREKAGGTVQNGVMTGVRFTYDRIKRFGFYWGLESSFAQGIIKGETGRGASIKSELTDIEVEGRLGFTLQMRNDWRPTLTPFVGYGYFVQKNNFRSPSPVELHFKDSFKYSTIGFLSSINLLCDLAVGINYKMKYMIDGRSEVSHDPDNDPISLLMDDKIQYVLDLPITYCLYWKESNIYISLVPFFQYRHYGGHENFPFDFIDTRFYNLGGRLLIGFYF